MLEFTNKKKISAKGRQTTYATSEHLLVESSDLEPIQQEMAQKVSNQDMVAMGAKIKVLQLEVISLKQQLDDYKNSLSQALEAIERLERKQGDKAVVTGFFGRLRGAK